MKNKQNKNLEIMRHSGAHILAAAVNELWPNIRFAIGPAIENGFYYDFDFGGEKVSDDDFKKIEKKMKHFIKQNLRFEKFEVDIDKAIKKEELAGQNYKKELLKNLKSEGEKSVSYYKIGNFEDLCSGPHIESSNAIKVDTFKLDKITGAYWRGDEKNKMLTRIYVLMFATKEELNKYLELRKEAEKRDHRKIGKEMDLFHIDEKVGLGLPLWHPKGAILWRLVEDYWYKRHLESGYDLVRSPHIGNRILWETSGHWGFIIQVCFHQWKLDKLWKNVKKKRK